MITIIETNENGARREMSFTDRRECVDALRQLFGSDALKTESQRVRDQANSALRSAWQAREVDPSVFFRRGNQSD